MSNLIIRTLLSTHVALSCSLSSAQLYDTAETRRQAAEAQRGAKGQKSVAETKQAEEFGRQKTEMEAKQFVGNTYWYVPNPAASKRITFFSEQPTRSDPSWNPTLIFFPTGATSFVVTRVQPMPSPHDPDRLDDYLLELKFPDNKIGFVNVIGNYGLKENLYNGQRLSDREYIYTDLLEATKEAPARAKEAAAIERIERERVKKQQEVALERKREEQARQAAKAAQMAKPTPRIGMTMEQVINQTSWGKPYDINRTTNANGTREQWVYSSRRYLYFDNGILTTMQD